MVLTAPARIQAPAVALPKGGLLAVADVIDVGADSRAAFGFDYYSYLCGDGGLYAAPCGQVTGPTFDTEKTLEGGELVTAYPFAVYAGVDCDLFGRDEYGPAARNKLTGLEERLVGQAFQEIVNANLTPITVPVPVAASYSPSDVILAAVASLEQYAGRNYAGLPVLHLSRTQTAVLAAANYVVVNVDGSLQTVQGTPIANSPGYEEFVPWITGAVHIWRTPIEVHSVDSVMTNTAQGLAERIYSVAVDCFVAIAEPQVQP
jgi:hypothetical protein